MATKAKEIARLTGLSLPTIWHILGSKGHLYRPETREKVIDVARSLGYRPNTSARAVSTGKFGCVALLMSTQEYLSSLPAPVLRGINDVLTEKDMHLTVLQLPNEKLAKKGYVPKVLTQSMADGLLINYTHYMPEKVAEFLEMTQIPAVWINTDRKQDCVHPDDFTAGHEATKHLIGLGHKRIAYLGYFPSNHYSVKHRGDGYARAMKEAQLRPRRISKLCSHSEWRKVAFEVMSSDSRPTALVAYGSTAALSFEAAAMSMGLRIPEDISVVVFGGTPWDDTGISYTTWLTPEYEVGRAAIDMLMRKIEQPKKRISSEAIPYNGSSGETCAPPPGLGK